MPTAGKLVGAVLFALLGYVLAELYVPGLPEGTAVGRMRLYCAAVGLGCGWMVMGPQARGSVVGSVNAGLQTVVAMVLVALLGFAIVEMFEDAFRRLYDGPIEAIVGMLQTMADFGLLLLRPPVMIAMVVGGAGCGLLTGMAGRRWA